VISQFCFCIAACDTLTQNMSYERFFHHLNSLKSDRKISDCTFWKFSYKRKFSFLLISCTRNRHSTVIESYIRRDDVIRCELDLALIEKLINYLILTDDCRERENVDKLSQIIVTKRFTERIIIRFLKLREIE
jgi:hypothetical protein